MRVVSQRVGSSPHQRIRALLSVSLSDQRFFRLCNQIWRISPNHDFSLDENQYIVRDLDTLAVFNRQEN